MELKDKLSVLIMTFVIGSSALNFTQVIVEEGRAATLQCPGFTPTPGGDQRAWFYWYKAPPAPISYDNRVAFLAKRDGIVHTLRDLAGRATIDNTTGALQINQTRLSDNHFYTCRFVFTSVGGITNKTHLLIYITPSKEDLRLTANPPGPVPVGQSVTFNCSVPRVRPLGNMYWQFSNGGPIFRGYRRGTNSDGSNYAFVQYSLKVNRSHHGRKLVCHLFSSRRISSEGLTIQVLFKPLGKPSLKSNKTAVKVNSKVDLNCDSGQLEGSATWFVWQLANGTVLGNTTKPTLTYTTKEKEEILQFVCIAGNWLGQSDNSETLTITVQNSAKLIGKPSLKSSKTAVKVNSKVDLRCDSSQVSGSATWFAWQFANGTVLGNTTQPILTYNVQEEKTLQFVCIAGNWMGQSDKSEPLMITMQSSECNNQGLIIGMAICAGVTIAVIITGIVCFIRRQKVGDHITQTMTEYDVEYENEGPVPPALPRAMKNGTGLDYENRGVMVEGPRSSDDSTYTSLTK